MLREPVLRDGGERYRSDGHGVHIRVEMASEVEIRLFVDGDSVDALTDLLHRAYCELRVAGFDFSAGSQSPAQTLWRISQGECFIAVDAGRVIGTVTMWPPSQDNRCVHYRRLEVAHFGQFAVDPASRGRGIGEALLAHVEDHALRRGYLELALDTAVDAERLISMYAKRGYRFVDRVRWRGKRRENVVMSKPLVRNDRS